MSTEDFEAIKKIIYDLTIFDDGTRGAQTPRDQSRRIIAETLLRIPESVREKVLEEAIFITIGGARARLADDPFRTKKQGPIKRDIRGSCMG